MSSTEPAYDGMAGGAFAAEKSAALRGGPGHAPLHYKYYSVPANVPRIAQHARQRATMCCPELTRRVYCFGAAHAL
eukprot:662614-Rhodomonas_salina.5